jgi:hypothetical protein
MFRHRFALNGPDCPEESDSRARSERTPRRQVALLLSPWDDARGGSSPVAVVVAGPVWGKVGGGSAPGATVVETREESIDDRAAVGGTRGPGGHESGCSASRRAPSGSLRSWGEGWRWLGACLGSPPEGGMLRRAGKGFAFPYPDDPEEGDLRSCSESRCSLAVPAGDQAFSFWHRRGRPTGPVRPAVPQCQGETPRSRNRAASWSICEYR